MGKTDIKSIVTYTNTIKPITIRRADSRFASSQWETALLCNDVSHWLDANLESALSEIKEHISDFVYLIYYPHLTSTDSTSGIYGQWIW